MRIAGGFAALRNVMSEDPPPIRQRVRIRFRKEHDLRLISHLDLLRTLERLFRRAELPLGMSEGFHPKPRMSFPSALAVGIAGTDEVMELELSEERSAEEILAVLMPHLPPGLAINSLEVMPQGSKKAQVRFVQFELPLPSERREAAAQRIEQLWAEETHVVQREEGRGPVDVRSYVDRLELADDRLRMRLRVTGEGAARPREVLEALGLDDLESQGFYLSRTAVELET
jgi:radical SAM-linked protein